MGVGRSLRKFRPIGLQCKCCKCVWFTFYMIFILIGLDLSTKGWEGKVFRTCDGKEENRKEEKRSEVKDVKVRGERRMRY